MWLGLSYYCQQTPTSSLVENFSFVNSKKDILLDILLDILMYILRDMYPFSVFGSVLDPALLDLGCHPGCTPLCPQDAHYPDLNLLWSSDMNDNLRINAQIPMNTSRTLLIKLFDLYLSLILICLFSFTPLHNTCSLHLCLLFIFYIYIIIIYDLLSFFQ